MLNNTTKNLTFSNFVDPASRWRQLFDRQVGRKANALHNIDWVSPHWQRVWSVCRICVGIFDVNVTERRDHWMRSKSKYELTVDRCVSTARCTYAYSWIINWVDVENVAYYLPFELCSFFLFRSCARVGLKRINIHHHHHHNYHYLKKIFDRRCNDFDMNDLASIINYNLYMWISPIRALSPHDVYYYLWQQWKTAKRNAPNVGQIVVTGIRRFRYEPKWYRIRNPAPFWFCSIWRAFVIVIIGLR